MNFYCVKTLTSGFEANVFLCSEDENSVNEYIKNAFQNVLTAYQISDMLATDLFKIGYKIYYVPKFVEETNVPVDVPDEIAAEITSEDS